MECCAACREPLDPNDRPPVWPCCLARGHSACYGAAAVCPAYAPSPNPRRVTRNVVVSPTTVVDAARIQRARMLGELCYTIPGSQLPADRKRAERFATQYLGVAA